MQMESTAFLVRDKGFNGMITHDKCCCTRGGQLQWSWGRPLRLRHAADLERRYTGVCVAMERKPGKCMLRILVIGLPERTQTTLRHGL